MTAVAVLALAPTAYAVTVNPDGGPPGSSYTAQVSCTSEPEVYTADMKMVPAATIVPKQGTQSSPGTWTYHLQAGQYDQMVRSWCGSQEERTRYDVDAPRLFPGPTVTWAGISNPELRGTAVVGTDCPAGSSASVTLTGEGGYTNTQTADIDQYGDWQISVPESAPQTMTANATCGDLTYEPISVRRWVVRPPGESVETSSSTTTSTIPTPPSTPASQTGSTPSQPSAAQPVPGSPSYTG